MPVVRPAGALIASAIALAGWLPATPALDPILEKHCIRCHKAGRDKGDFRMDTLSHDFTDESTAQRWAQVMFRMNTGEMPPEDEDRPTADELAEISEWITARIDEGRAARLAKRGPVEFYRLSREEYAHTVRDLLGVHYDPTLPGALNEDPRWHGFERIGSMLTLSPSHVDRYFRAAETVLDRAFPTAPPETVVRRADAIEMRHRADRAHIEELGIQDQVRVALWPAGRIPGFRPYWGGRLKSAGIYRAKIQLSGLPGPDGSLPHLSIWNSDLKASVFDEDVLAPEDAPIILEFETFLDLDTELDIRNEIPRVFNELGNHTFNVLDHGRPGYFIGTKDFSHLNPTGYKLFDDDGKPLYPLLLIDWIEWKGPITTEADLVRRDGLIPQNEGDLAEARETLRRFATRAWRRPATDPEIDRYLQIISSETDAGETFAAAYRSAMIGVLTSKNFYYLKEGSATERRQHLDDWELAARLSYFLWSSMPDDELYAAAENGSLRTPDGLRRQLRRMLADPKIARFTDSFARQWLQLHNVGMFPPDPGLYPEYDLWLEKSMVMETTGYFAEMLAGNLPLREFLRSDWTVANPRLASFYGLPPLDSPGFKRVSLRPEDRRGGLLTQASVLMLTSDGTRHRPVHRGVWVSEAIFGRTPPPPPPNVDPIEPVPSDQPKATVRMQLEAHATHPTCASCHRNIDPLGFAFENYNAIGRWRTVETVATGQGENPPVDASGVLPGNRTFAGPEEFKALLTADTGRFAEAFAEHLATYALRRLMTLDDRIQLKAIADSTRSDDYRLRSLIEAFVLSDHFRTR